MNIVLTVGMILLVGGLLVTMFVVQARHKANVRRRQKIQSFATQNKKMESILRNLPPQYLTEDVRSFIYQAMAQNIRQMLKLKADNIDYLRSDLEVLKRQQESKPSKEVVKITTSEQANQTRGALRSLFEVVKEAYEQKRLLGKEAERMIQQIERRMMEAAIEFYDFQIANSERQKRFKEAIGLTKKMIEMLSRSKRHEEYRQKLMTAKAHVDELYNAWKEHTKEQNTDKTSLADSMEELLNEGDDWKKDPYA